MHTKLDKNIFTTARIGLGLYFLYYFYSYNYSLDYLIETSLSFNQYTNSHTAIPFNFYKKIIEATTFLGFIFSLFFVFGFLIRISALILWLGLLVTINVSPLIAQIHYSYLSIILIIFILFNEQKIICLNIDYFKNRMIDGSWRLLFGKLFYLTLFISGCSKLFLSEWRSGIIVKYICKQIYFTSYVDAYCGLPEYIFNFLTYTVLFIELASVLFFIKKFRFIVWSLSMFLQIGLFFFARVWNMSSAFILIQLFIFHSTLFKDDVLYKYLTIKK